MPGGGSGITAGNNPLWNLWVEQFQMAKLLSNSDILRRRDADAGTGAAYVQHDDFAWFAFPNGASPAANGPSPPMS